MNTTPNPTPAKYRVLMTIDIPDDDTGKRPSEAMIRRRLQNAVKLHATWTATVIYVDLKGEPNEQATS